jgi:hypothetical protein
MDRSIKSTKKWEVHAVERLGEIVAAVDMIGTMGGQVFLYTSNSALAETRRLRLELKLVPMLNNWMRSHAFKFILSEIKIDEDEVEDLPMYLVDLRFVQWN